MATDILINQTKIILNNTNATNITINNLADCVDYFEEKNKEIFPPTLEISLLENINECKESGKFRIRGKFSNDINEEMSFELPLSFPASSVKCTVKEALSNENVQMICKVQKGFKFVKSLVIEQRMIKKGVKNYFLLKVNHFLLIVI